MSYDPKAIAAIYCMDGDAIKRVSYDRSQFDELFAVNPQLATYAVGARAFEHSYPYQLAEEYGVSAMDLGTEIHRQIEHYRTINAIGDLIHGGPHTNTVPDYTAIEMRIMTYYHDLWYREFMDACYGINRPKNKFTTPLDTGRNPAKPNFGEIK